MLHHRRAGIVLLVALLAVPFVLAAERTHQIEAEDYFTINVIMECAASPDGKYVAYTEMRWHEDPDLPRSTDLWVVETETKRLSRLTFDPASDSSPQWGAANSHLYFMSKKDRGEKRPPYDGTTQVWVTGVHPGEPFPVTRVKGGVQGFQISADGKTIYYLREGEEAAGDWKELRKKFPDLEYGDGKVNYTELWALDLETWREKKLVAPERVIREFKVSPDQARVAMITTPDDRLITNEGQSRVDICDLATGAMTYPPDRVYRADAPSPFGWLEFLAWSHDSNRLAWTISFDGYPTEIIVADLAGETPDVWELERPNEVHVTGNLEWVPGQKGLTFLAEDRGAQRIYYVDDVREQTYDGEGTFTPGDFVVHAFDFSRNGEKLAFVKSDTQHGRDLFVAAADVKGVWSQLTDINPQIDTWKLPSIQRVQWKAPDGQEVEGMLELPPDYKEGDGPLPMVVELHGGPTAATMYRLRFWIYGRTLFAAKGYALLSPNYRGSTGYGDKFLTDLVGRENDIDVQDILAGVDALVERGIADPERLAVMGWSNGGFLTNALITTTQRFKAASSGAGVLDQFMQFGLEDTPGHVVNFNRGLPWDRIEEYVKASPAYKLGQVTTPTIIHVGGNDARVPRENSQSLYRSLKEYVKVPTALLVYPGAGHGLVLRKHRQAKMEWDLAWFEKYVLGNEE